MKHLQNVTIYMKSMWPDPQNILLFKGCSGRKLLVLMKKGVLGSLPGACLDQVLSYSEIAAV